MSFTQSVLTPLLTGGGSATVITGGIGAVVLRAVKRIAEDVVREGTADVRQDVSDLKVEFAKQTGGNSNGLRQAVNEIRDDVTTVKEDVAFLKGVHAGEQKQQAAA